MNMVDAGTDVKEAGAPTQSGRLGGLAARALTVAARFASRDVRGKVPPRRPVLEQVRWEGGTERDLLIATDTYRLYTASVDREEHGIRPEPGEAWFVPAAAVLSVTSARAVRAQPVLTLGEVCPLAEDATKRLVENGEPGASHELDVMGVDLTGTCKCRRAIGVVTEDLFPNWRKVQPDEKDLTYRAELRGGELEEYARALALLAQVEKGKRVEHDFTSEGLMLRAESERVEATATIELTGVERDGNLPNVCAFNGDFARELVELVLEAAAEGATWVAFRIPHNPLAPTLLEGEDWSYILMPMQIF